MRTRVYAQKAMAARLSSHHHRRRVRKKTVKKNGQQMARYVARSFWLWNTEVTWYCTFTLP